MKPSKIEFKIGETIHKQPIKLIYERDYMNIGSWSIERGQANQRDDASKVYGLPTEALIKIGEIAKEQQKSL
mgnify:CR=1 FL=1